MARLIAVCRSDDYPFERRQIPLVVDENLTMAIQFSDRCVCCDQAGIKPAELERFSRRYAAFSSDELTAAFTVQSKQIFSLLALMVPCVGCRRSVERLFKQLVESGYPALEPLVIAMNSILSIKRDYLCEPTAMYALLYVHGSKLNTVLDAIPKSKKNKRCVLHLLDIHKAKSLGSWLDIWNSLSEECREAVVLVDSEDLIDILDNYLRKHRFCSECKSKVLHVYSILMGDVESSSETGYSASLYDGLRCCRGERHIHIRCQTEYITELIGRAEPELSGRHRERHAKTLDIAQEEVLTCLGIYLYERLHSIGQKLRAEEQTWQILFCLAVDALRKNFELAVEKKQGVSNLELMCRELLQEEQAKEEKLAQKRLKRKKRKNKNKQNDADLDKENCMCLVGSTGDRAHQYGVDSGCSSSNPCDQHSGEQRGGGCSDSGASVRSDAGYSSGYEYDTSCPRSSQVVCSAHSSCSHHGNCSDHISQGCHNPCLPPGCVTQSKGAIGDCEKCGSSEVAVSRTTESIKSQSTITSLQDMLDASCGSGTEDFISEEEILQFRQANQQSLHSRREQLRATLRQRFANMQRRRDTTASFQFLSP